MGAPGVDHLGRPVTAPGPPAGSTGWAAEGTGCCPAEAPPGSSGCAVAAEMVSRPTKVSTARRAHGPRGRRRGCGSDMSELRVMAIMRSIRGGVYCRRPLVGATP